MFFQPETAPMTILRSPCVFRLKPFTRDPEKINHFYDNYASIFSGMINILFWWLQNMAYIVFFRDLWVFQNSYFNKYKNKLKNGSSGQALKPSGKSNSRLDLDDLAGHLYYTYWPTAFLYAKIWSFFSYTELSSVKRTNFPRLNVKWQITRCNRKVFFATKQAILVCTDYFFSITYCSVGCKSARASAKLVSKLRTDQ